MSMDGKFTVYRDDANEGEVEIELEVEYDFVKYGKAEIFSVVDVRSQMIVDVERELGFKDSVLHQLQRELDELAADQWYEYCDDLAESRAFDAAKERHLDD